MEMRCREGAGWNYSATAITRIGKYAYNLSASQTSTVKSDALPPTLNKAINILLTTFKRTR